MADDKFYTARVTKRTDFAHDLWMVRMDPGGDFKFTPGQYGTLGVERRDGKKTERAYSIVSSPYESELEFFLRTRAGRRADSQAVPVCKSAIPVRCAR